VIAEGLKIYLQDNCQAWVMDSTGHYRHKKSPRAQKKSAQSELLKQFTYTPK
jgi:polyphosphate kinase